MKNKHYVEKHKKGLQQVRNKEIQNKNENHVTDTHTHNHLRLSRFCLVLPGVRRQKGKTNLEFFLKQETVSGSGIS